MNNVRVVSKGVAENTKMCREMQIVWCPAVSELAILLYNVKKDI